MPPKKTLSGGVPGILTNGLALRTRPPRGEEGEEVGDVDVAVGVDVGDMPGVRSPCSEKIKEVGDIDHGGIVQILGARQLAQDKLNVAGGRCRF